MKNSQLVGCQVSCNYNNGLKPLNCKISLNHFFFLYETCYGQEFFLQEQKPQKTPLPTSLLFHSSSSFLPIPSLSSHFFPLFPYLFSSLPFHSQLLTCTLLFPSLLFLLFPCPFPISSTLPLPFYSPTLPPPFTPPSFCPIFPPLLSS